MRSTLRVIISSFLFLMTVLIKAQLISVQSSISSDSMMIGDQLIYTLRVEAAQNVDFMLPMLSDTLSRDLEILSPLSADTISAEGKRVVNHRYLITGFEPGMQVIPTQRVVYSTGELSDTALSMPLMISVVDPVVDTSQQIKPIKPPINTPLTLREALPWAGMGMGALLLIGGIYYLIRRYRRKQAGPEGIPLKPTEPAHVIAFRELDKIKAEKIWEKGKVKLYYTRLTEVTRQYIERQYGIPAMEQTTEEIIQAFRKVNREDSLLDEMLRELLELADLVKFAKEDPLPMDNQTNLNNAYLFIQKTYPLFFKTEPGKIEEEAGDE